jgi:hypothetical protein
LFQPKDSEISEIFFFPSANLTNLARFCKEKIQILYITKFEGGKKKSLNMTLQLGGRWKLRIMVCDVFHKV